MLQPLPTLLPHPSQPCLPLLPPSIHTVVAAVAATTCTSSVPLPVSSPCCQFPPCILLSSYHRPSCCNLDDLILAAYTDGCEI
ncbi:hypothetical protein BHE74_00036857 [Ensete ventricosum]|nr:hypothetical protein BHE74_00036857 [Ensete ventricosum]